MSVVSLPACGRDGYTQLFNVFDLFLTRHVTYLSELRSTESKWEGGKVAFGYISEKPVDVQQA